jgi:hypothetical protein
MRTREPEHYRHTGSDASVKRCMLSPMVEGERWSDQGGTRRNVQKSKSLRVKTVLCVCVCVCCHVLEMRAKRACRKRDARPTAQDVELDCGTGAAARIGSP